MQKYIMLLNDGETFTNLDGCAIVAYPEHFTIDDVEANLVALHRGERHRIQVVTVFQDPA